MIRRSHCAQALFSAVALAATLPFSAYAETTPNLLTNGDASNNLTGWSQGGTSTPNATTYQSNSVFYGGPNSGNGTLTQTIPLSGYVPTFQQIQNGEITFNASFVEQSASVNFLAGLNLHFVGSAHADIAIAPFANLNRTPASTATALPAGTQQIQYAMVFNRSASFITGPLNAFADNNSLTLSYLGSSWNGDSYGFWNDASHWRSGVPAAGAAALVTSPSNFFVEYSSDYSASPLSELYVDAGGGATFECLGSAYMNAGTEYIGNIASANYTENAGTNKADNLFLGYYAGSSGAYSLSGGNLTVASNLVVGNAGAGSLSINAGTVTVTGSPGLCTIGALGQINMGAGSLTANSLQLYSGGSLSVSGGQFSVGNITILGNPAPPPHVSFSGGTFTCNTLGGVNFSWTGGTLHMLSSFDLDSIGTNLTLSNSQNLVCDGTLNFGTTTSTINTLTGNASTSPTLSATDITIGSVAADSLYVSGLSSLSANSTISVGSPTVFNHVARLIISAGYVTTPSLIIYGNSNVSLSGGTLQLASLSLVSPTQFTWTSGTLHFTSDITINSSFPLGSSISLANGMVLIANNMTNNGTVFANSNSTISMSSFINNGNFNGNSFLNVTAAGSLSINHGTMSVSGYFNCQGSILNDNFFALFGPQTWGASSVFTNNGGSASFSTNAGANLAIVVNAGTVNLDNQQHLKSILISSGLVTINGSTAVSALSFGGTPSTPTGLVNLIAGKLILQAANGTVPATLASLQSEALFALTHSASAGITGSSLPAHTGLAIFANANLPKLFSTFGGIGVDSNSILIAPELLGDTNIDGKVDITDLNTLLNNFGTATPNWTSGNFDNAPTIDLTDLSYVLNNFGLTYANFSTTPVSGGGSEAVPEPASLALLSIAAIVALSRRRPDISLPSTPPTSPIPPVLDHPS